MEYRPEHNYECHLCYFSILFGNIPKHNNSLTLIITKKVQRNNIVPAWCNLKRQNTQNFQRSQDKLPLLVTTWDAPVRNRVLLLHCFFLEMNRFLHKIPLAFGKTTGSNEWGVWNISVLNLLILWPCLVGDGDHIRFWWGLLITCNKVNSG